MREQISSNEISIVVQGSISKKYTSQCLLKLRQVFPESEIILSTQEGQDIMGCCFDKVVFSIDPGAVVQDEKLKVLNNVNRQLVTTQAGLRVCTRDYILKIRTDIYIENNSFISYFLKYYEKEADFKGLRHRVLICSYYTRNPRILDIPFHPSDWIMFGYSEDVKNYYDIGIQSKEDEHWFKVKEKQTRAYKNYLCRYFPEQHLCINAMKRFYSISCENYYDNSIENIELTERVLAENFIVLTYTKQLNITFPKYNPNRYKDSGTLIQFEDWLVLYERYNGTLSKNRWRIYRIKVFFARFFYKYVYYKVSCVLDILRLKKYIRKMRSKSTRKLK